MSEQVERLIERLREESRACQSIAWSRRDGGQDYSIAASLVDEAADIIERLSAEKAALEEERAEAQTAFRDMYELYGETARQLAEARGALANPAPAMKAAGAHVLRSIDGGHDLAHEVWMQMVAALPAEQGEE